MDFLTFGMTHAIVNAMNANDKGEKTMFEDFEIIDAYNAKQAEDDGILVNVTAEAKETGFKWTTRISRGVHELCTPPKSNKIQSYRGRLHDVLWMAFLAIKRNHNNDSPIAYKVKIGRKIETLWITIDGTMGEPAIHIILPSEY
jgi:hypothetical protein